MARTGFRASHICSLTYADLKKAKSIPMQR